MKKWWKYFEKKICNRWRKKNEIPNKWKWLIVRKIIDCNPCTTTLIFFVLSISILSVNDAKTRLKKSFKNVSVLPFKLLWYWQIGNKNIESIFKIFYFCQRCEPIRTFPYMSVFSRFIFPQNWTQNRIVLWKLTKYVFLQFCPISVSQDFPIDENQTFTLVVNLEKKSSNVLIN